VRRFPRDKVEQRWRRAQAAKAQRLIARKPGFAKRFNRIAELGPEAIATADVIRHAFLDIGDYFGEAAALDIFEHAVESYRLKNPKRRGKPKRLHDSGRDARLLEVFDGTNSIISRVRKGELPLEGVENPSTITQEQLATYMVRDKEGRKRWNATSHKQLLRLKEARRTHKAK
jgi:hypothetical protein